MTFEPSKIVGPLTLEQTTNLLTECVNSLTIETVITVLRDCLDRGDQLELLSAFEPKESS